MFTFGYCPFSMSKYDRVPLSSEADVRSDQHAVLDLGTQNQLEHSYSRPPEDHSRTCVNIIERVLIITLTYISIALTSGYICCIFVFNINCPLRSYLAVFVAF